MVITVPSSFIPARFSHGAADPVRMLITTTNGTTQGKKTFFIGLSHLASPVGSEDGL
jgi:hypothetical protein